MPRLKRVIYVQSPNYSRRAPCALWVLHRERPQLVANVTSSFWAISHLPLLIEDKALSLWIDRSLTGYERGCLFRITGQINHLHEHRLCHRYEPGRKSLTDSCNFQLQELLLQERFDWR